MQVLHEALLLLLQPRAHVLQVARHVARLQLRRRLGLVVRRRRREELRLELRRALRAGRTTAAAAAAADVVLHAVHAEVVQHAQQRVQERARDLVAVALALDEREQALHGLARHLGARVQVAAEDLQPHLP